MKRPSDTRDREVARAICRWFARAARDLPWRTEPRDPYLSLLSEFMLQQTQVSRVLEKWAPIVSRFPDVATLARAEEDQVLSLWSGMGYYRRARSLHAAAKEVMARFKGAIPADTEELLSLPGVGRYTAGAISSIAFGRSVSIVDGNITRVLLRLDGKPMQAGTPKTAAWAWKRADTLVQAAREARVPVRSLNEGLMELGALVCTPRAPRCEQCPLRKCCAGASEGTQLQIPAPKPKSQRRILYCEVVVVSNGRGVLVEQRPRSGMWPGLWQAPTWEPSSRGATASDVARWIGVKGVEAAEVFSHQTTHRDVRFRVWRAEVGPPLASGRVFVSRRRLASLALSNPQRRILLGTAEGRRG